MTTKKKLPGAARVGIGGPVGSGKTALVERLIPVLRSRNIEVAVVANDLVTREDAERIKAMSDGPALPPTEASDDALLALARHAIGARFDPVHAGYGDAQSGWRPKFPPHAELLWVLEGDDAPAVTPDGASFRIAVTLPPESTRTLVMRGRALPPVADDEK